MLGAQVASSERVSRLGRVLRTFANTYMLLGFGADGRLHFVFDHNWVF